MIKFVLQISNLYANKTRQTKKKEEKRKINKQKNFK